MSNPPVFPTQFNSTDAVESTAIVWSEFTPDGIFNAGHYATLDCNSVDAGGSTCACTIRCAPLLSGRAMEVAARRHNTLDDGMWEWQATKVKLIALTHIVDVREYLLAVECAGHIQHEWSRRGRYVTNIAQEFGLRLILASTLKSSLRCGMRRFLDQDNIATLGEAIEWGAHNIDLNTVKPGSLRRFKNMAIISWGPYHFFDLLKVPKMHIRNHQEGFPSLWQLEEFVRWHLEEEFMSWCNPLEDRMEWAYNTTQAPEAYNINATAVRMQSLQRFQNAVITGVNFTYLSFVFRRQFQVQPPRSESPSPAQDSNEDDEEMPELRNCSGSDDSDEE
ncbi:hypothetical protein B0H16DRAFT_1477465 [Mycena metata]|uniref:Uncharacterized protein n=1 Tax=Mycena metata TaxID=1033252 RepID=A0AAD7H9U5_9AGAR|nr:hypothetical protein B0H16DRAFT_1477465 [Mycena metata]